ncbi:ABC transporter permease [Actinotalea subterranea]|uniref:ABC transporter permease n=1 Tax=Actinotalea subterranea TaxID=2607497 RepID=UPI0011EFC05C|nr:ABC transporter permease [Actinotalea subterranea]
MFLAWRELWFARSRFGLMGAVVGLVAVLVVMLSGLSSGLVNDGVSGLKKLPVTAFAFDDGTAVDSAFSRSTVDRDQLAAWSAQDGVAEAALFGNQLVNAEGANGEAVDLALFGVEPDSFLAPAPDAVADGEGLGDATGIVVSDTVTELGLGVGDTVTIERLGTELTIVGVLDGQHTFGHVDVAYVPLETWQEIHSGALPGTEVRPEAYDEATAVALSVADGAELDTAAGDSDAATMTVPLDESFDGSPGYAAETLTLNLIQLFLYAISALVVGAFFTVWTIQRKHEIAVARAMGASTGYLVRDALGQAAVVLVVSTVVGMAVGVGFGALMTSTPMPFALEAGPLAVAAALLVGLGLLGAAASVGRIAHVDPLTALGGQR